MNDYLDEMVAQYIGTALWSELDDDGQPLSRTYSPRDIDSGSRCEMARDCAAFVESAGDDLEGIAAETAGHLFWLNRAGHGAGFWELRLGQRADRLSQLCENYGELCLYIGDDGKLYTT